MTTSYPVHPDDVEMLLDIRRYLIGYRITNGWTQEQLSQKINGTKGAVYGLESDLNFQWRFSRLQQWPVPFGVSLRATLEFDGSPNEEVGETRLMSFIRRDPSVKVYEELSEKGPQWQRAYLVAALRSARQGRGWDQGELGRRLGITGGAVSRWEVSSDQVLLSKLLAHARALNGRLILEVTR